VDEDEVIEIASSVKAISTGVQTMQTELATVKTHGTELDGRMKELEQVVAERVSSRGADPRYRPGGVSLMKDAPTEQLQRLAAVRGRTAFSSQLRLKDIVTSLDPNNPTQTGYPVGAVRDPNLYGLAQRERTLVDVLPHVPMRVGNRMEYVTLTPAQGGANYFQQAEGHLKAEGDFGSVLSEAGIATIAVWQRFSRQLLADVPALGAQVDHVFRTRLLDFIERHLVRGDGTNGGILGIVPQATPFTPTGTRSPHMADAVAQALTALRIAGWPAGLVVMHPHDWLTITTARDSQGRYLVADWRTANGLQLWGVPVVLTSSVPIGHALVMDPQAATILDREQVSVSISNEDQDNFIKNLATVLVEARLGLMVTNPSAVLLVSLSPGTTT